MEFKRIVVKVAGNLKVVCNSYSGAVGSNRILLFSHATGFCKETWNPVIEELRKLGNNDNIVLVDQRNHGDSAVENSLVLGKNPPPFDWNLNGSDLITVVNTLYPGSKKKVIGIGHSGGAASMLLGHLQEPTFFDSIIAIESVYPNPKEPGPLQLATITKKRRNHFPSKQEAFDSFKPKPAFAEFTEKSLRIYVEHGFRDANPALGDSVDTGVVLKCPPVHEASVFEGGNHAQLLDKLSEIRCPTLCINGELSNFIPKNSLAHAQSQLKGAVWKIIPGAGHFLVMQYPEIVAKEIFQWVNRPAKL